jgi:alanine dehydrogenase
MCIRDSILVVNETRAGETRVALIPSDVAELVRAGHTVYVEKHAGLHAGHPDQEYMDAGASIRHLESNTPKGYRHLFTDITPIVRVKRPDREREKVENQVLA